MASVHMVQDKVNPRSVKGIFMGYPQGTKSYRVWLPESGKSIISRNIVFDEDKLYWKSREEKLKGKKKVTFSSDLVRGPSNTNEGGASSSSSESVIVRVLSQIKRLRDRKFLRLLRVLMVSSSVTELEELPNFPQSLKVETLLRML